MKPPTLQYEKYMNWKEYFKDKFSNTKYFSIEQFDKNDENLEKYRVTSIDKNCQAEIIVSFFKKDESYFEIFDIHFNNPNSPKLTEDNKLNEYGFDGKGTTFSQKNLRAIDDWINIPVFKGWIEQTIFYDDQEIKSDCIWIQDNKEEVIPIRQNYLDNSGCLLFFLIPIKITIMNRKLKSNPNKIKIKKTELIPMVR
jgi:hypothetical protein